MSGLFLSDGVRFPMVVSRFDRLWLVAVLLFALLCCGDRSAAASDETFPVYECITPNVAFWRDVYAKYPSSQGVIHDSVDLGVVYEVVDLEPDTGSAARERNSDKVKAVKAKYENILLRLAAGNSPVDAEEKRVLALFGPRPPGPDALSTAATRIRFQLGQKDHFMAGLRRSGAYLPQFREIIRSYGLPVDLAYLPHVESSFNYNAYSKFGAAGVWQFTQETGKRFLTIDYTVDERRDPLRATHAAAQLLKENYEKLGSWPLALTAYNHGVNGMRRAKEAKGDYPTIFREYESGLFKFASRNFYSEFLAAREVAENYRKYFGEVALAAPVESYEVPLKGHMPFQDLLRHFKVDKETFRQLNPALREPVYLGQKYVPKGYQVRLPASKEMVQLAKQMPEEVYKSQQKRSGIYLVRRGDTVSSIAKRHGVAVGELVAANQLGKRATIYVGQNLRIPKMETAPTLIADRVPKKVVEKRLASLLPQVPPPDSSVTSASQSQPAEKAPAVVKTGVVPRPSAPDAPVASPVAPSNPVQITLTGPQDPQATPGAEEAVSPAALVDPAVVVGNFNIERVYGRKGKQFGVIRVVAEETLGHYADWLGVNARELRKLNRLAMGKELQLDREITIPLDGVSRERFEELRYEYHREMEEDFFAAYQVQGVRRYQIKPGDNIWRLCQVEFELPLWLVKKYNAELDVNNLKRGAEIVVLVVVEKKS